MKVNKNLTKVVSGVLSTSILAASCTEYAPMDTYVYGNIIVDDSDLGAIAIPISLKLKSEDVLYIQAIQNVTIDIVKDPQKAEKFNEDPSSMLANYGYNGDINLDENILNITKALAPDFDGFFV